ncbi:MAG: hypothetical protein ACE5HO_11035 [bacterium]
MRQVIWTEFGSAAAELSSLRKLLVVEAALVVSQPLESGEKVW